MADRHETAMRSVPLRSGYRDPDGKRTDAPDQAYRLWELAQRLADQADKQRDDR